MKLTLLEIVQSVLSSLNSDNVNDVNDTIESSQVVDIVKDTYYEMLSYNDWPHLWVLRELEAVSDQTKPNFLRIPDEVEQLKTFSYDVTSNTDSNRKIVELTYREPEDFIRMLRGRDTSQTNVNVYDNGHGVDLFILDDKMPEFWTSFDDEYIVTDSYSLAEDTTLNGSKSSAHCKVIPVWSGTNTFVPDFPASFFPTFLAEVKSTASIVLKQQLSQKDEQRARRGLSHVRRKERFEKGDSWNRWGRK